MRRIDLAELSKFVSHALRHEPWVYGLELDDEGGVFVDTIVTALSKTKPEWAALSSVDLVSMIEKSNKRRHEIRDGRIRALYGHSIRGTFNHTPGTPPNLLFHGTTPGALSLIRTSGLLPMGRQRVHLSVDEEMAMIAGRRKGHMPIVLRILARNAHARGVRFFEGNERIWLADQVPPEFIQFEA